MVDQLTTGTVAKMAGVHRDTLLRWLRNGKVPEPDRNRHGWRIFTREEAQAIVEFADGGQPEKLRTPVDRLQEIDWDFEDADTGYLTHALHPYPAKFIPQLPNTLIQELSSVGDTVLDPFCGSGTSLVEALLLKRHAIGIDASPLACLVSRGKTVRLDEHDFEQLEDLRTRVESFRRARSTGALPLFPESDIGIKPLIPDSAYEMEGWFSPQVFQELGILRRLCSELASNRARTAALMAFSSIIVSVSLQDSDTRYVRKEQDLEPGETANRFLNRLEEYTRCLAEFADVVEPRFDCAVLHRDVLDRPTVEPVDLVVCSPPYPNAYSYHLYHRSRMLWLGMDQPEFKEREIGSHRKYSRKGDNAADADTFRAEMRTVLEWLAGRVRSGGYACFVLGNSIIKGETVNNPDILCELTEPSPFYVEANIPRAIEKTSSSFNPESNKDRNERILIFRRG